MLSRLAQCPEDKQCAGNACVCKPLSYNCWADDCDKNSNRECGPRAALSACQDCVQFTLKAIQMHPAVRPAGWNQ